MLWGVYGIGKINASSTVLTERERLKVDCVYNIYFIRWLLFDSLGSSLKVSNIRLPKQESTVPSLFHG